jgi:DNA repair protein RecN (Recombination protein N)
MLIALAIRDVVLVDRLDLAFDDGLSVLTGETGAGKSILLDALGLALGQRAEASLVRAGAEQASVTAEFALPEKHPVLAMLASQGLPAEPALLLRRQLGKDGRSRAFINDEPVSVGLLRAAGEALVEIAGQAGQHGLLEAALHRELLDGFGGLEREAAETAAAWKSWQDAAARRRDAEERLARARREEDFLRHAAAELAALKPEPGEAARLAEERALLMQGEKLVEALAAAQGHLGGEGSADHQLAKAQRRLERIAERVGGRLTPLLEALDRAAGELADATHQLRSLLAELDPDPARLERIEERLFALRGLARKHDRDPDALPALLEEMTAALADLDDQSGGFAELSRAEAAAKTAFLAAAEALHRARREAAGRFDKQVMAELPPLKLERAKFRTRVEKLPEGQASAQGLDRVAFEIATLPGVEPGPLGKIASGGELSRLMLALKVVLAAADPVPTLIFDEVDAGVGGATATAVGERLKRLAKKLQVIVVTHSPQVAALGRHHWRVEKTSARGGLRTAVEPLDARGRREEIARMLSGARVTDEARAAADKLMAGAR